MLQYFFNKKNYFIIEDYHKGKPFSSFLPGVSGQMGIPIWTFYVNRGQGISGFGIKDKDHPIMEFFPANSAYQYVSTYGFRTFIKVDGRIVEPFNHTPDSNKRIMGIKSDHFFIEEILENEGLSIKVTYANLNNVSLGGLIRRVEIKNLTSRNKTIEVIDGMPALLPYGVSSSNYKDMGNLVRSWMEVTKTNTKVPFYHLRASTGDEAEVEMVHHGYFYMNNSQEDASVCTIYDARVLFDYKTDLSYPVGFENKSIDELHKVNQVSANKVPCAFQGKKEILKPRTPLILDSVYGYGDDYERVEAFIKDIDFKDFIDKQFESSTEIIESITKDVSTKTNIKAYDEYMKQSYLDNVMRGGKPIVFKGKEKDKVYHIYSRKHGDQERDYNFYSLEPSFFSQGNGNYRDMNQNRRHDLLFEPKVRDFNVWMFYNLVQSDGYNPLSVNGLTFKIEAEMLKAVLLQLEQLGFEADLLQEITKQVAKDFTPGTLLNSIYKYSLSDTNIRLLLQVIIESSETNIEAEFGEGFWSDHFTYNQDLIDDFLTIYPESKQELLFEREEYKTYNAPYYVLPREQKYGLTKSGDVRQYGSIAKKENYQDKWMVDESGETIYMDLFGKLVILTLTKFMNLDPSGMGLEMEGNKPSWNDALNGLPGLLGSGTSETVELLRIVKFLIQSLTESDKNQVYLVEQIHYLAKELSLVLGDLNCNLSDKELINRWNKVNSLKDDYRLATREVIISTKISYKVTELITLLELIKEVLDTGITKAIQMGNGILPSYIVHDVSEYELLGTKTAYGLDAVKANGFKPRRLPLFLEGPARLMKMVDKSEAANIYDLIKKTDIYDKELKMYKTSASLEGESMEIGRIKAFTPGWLERESIFLHMTYKYILGILKAGLYDTFFEEIKHNLIPFLDPKVYGRPTTENSSFIASSVNPDSEIIGQGFVARLSGSTAEVLSMWKLMMVGKKWFSYEEGELRFEFDPILSGEFFDENGEVTFNLLGTTEVTYINKKLFNTYGPDGVKVAGIHIDGVRISTTYLDEIMSTSLRNQEIKKIEVFLE